MNIGGGQIRGAFFNFSVVKKCPFLHLMDAALSFYNNPCIYIYIYIYIYINIRTQSKCTKWWKQSSAINRNSLYRHKNVHWLHHRWNMYEHNVFSVTSNPSQSSSRRVSSLKDSSALLNKWEVNFTKVKSFLSLPHCLWWKPKIYIGTLSKCTKRWKQRSAIKQLLETLFLATKMYTGLT